MEKENNTEINWNEMDRYWEAQIADDFADFIKQHGRAAS